MLTSKQRSNLKAMASKLDTIMQIGKDGITDNLIRSLSQALEARELIKISVLNNCESSARELCDDRQQDRALPPFGAQGRQAYRAGLNGSISIPLAEQNQVFFRTKHEGQNRQGRKALCCA